MKRNFLRLAVLFACLLTGWTLGYLRFPMIKHNMGYWVGFLTCLAALLFLRIARLLWGKRKDDAPLSVSIWNMALFGSAVFIIAGGLIGSIWYKSGQMRKGERTYYQREYMRSLGAIEDGLRNNNRVMLMSHLLERIEHERIKHPDKSLSDVLIARLAALSFSFTPYRSFNGDSLAPLALSPERGQLLIALSTMGLDTGSWNSIMRNINFNQADLRGVKMPGVNWNGIQMEGADLEFADLSSCNLNNARLDKCNFRGAILNGSSMESASLKKANFSYTQLNDACLSKSVLNGSEMQHSQFQRADLTHAQLHWCNLNGAILKDVDLRKADVVRSKLNRVDLRGARLEGTNFYRIPVEGANLQNIVLDSCIVHHDWPDLISKASGNARLMKDYRMDIDSTIPGKSPIFYLIRIE